MAELLEVADRDPVAYLIALGEGERCPFPCAKCAADYLDQADER
jgi:hypothetical protein